MSPASHESDRCEVSQAFEIVYREKIAALLVARILEVCRFLVAALLRMKDIF